MTTHRKFLKSVNRRTVAQHQRRPDVTIADIVRWYPNSVWQSLIDSRNWISKLDISSHAKYLSRLSGRGFHLAVIKTLAVQNAD